DPLLGKISACGEDRAAAIARLSAALRDTAVLGPTTNLAFLQDVLAHPAFQRGETHTGFLAEHFATWRPGGDEAVAALAAALALARPAAPGGVLVAVAGRVWTFEIGEEARGAHGAAGSGAVTAPMPGKVVSVLIAEGDVVEVGQPLVVLEAMKMESTLAAEVAGRVTAVR